MKAAVKRQFAEFVEHIDFPVVIYIYETGRIIAYNKAASGILGDGVRNMNLIWENHRRQKLPREILNYGNEILYNKGIYRDGLRMEIDMEVNSFVLDKSHIIVGFFEQSYKQQFIKYLRAMVPRFYMKDEKLAYCNMNDGYAEDRGGFCKGEKDGQDQEEGIQRILTADEEDVVRDKECSYNLQQLKKLNQPYGSYVKMNRMPLIDRDGNCVGLMGIYTPVFSRDEYKRLFDISNRENQILNRIVGRSNIVVAGWHNEEGWPIEYISPNFGRYGFDAGQFYRKEKNWQDIIHPEDYTYIMEKVRKAKDEEVLVLEYRIIEPGGAIRWVRSESVPGIPGSHKEGGWTGVIMEMPTSPDGKTLPEPKAEPFLQKKEILLLGKRELSRKEETGLNQKGAIELYLKQAVKNGCVEFDIFYQPIVSSYDRSLCGAEALLRWASPDLGFINPAEFIPITEYLGLMIPLGEHILREVFRTSRQWSELLGRKFPLHINISVVQLVQPGIVDRMRNIAREEQTDCRDIILEVTESLAVEDMALMKNVLLELRAQGFQVALDNFGIGYSSLNHIMAMPFDYIKIDKSMISAYGTEKFNPGFFSAITEMAHSLDMEIVAEGVETKQQMDFLDLAHADKYQGYYFGKPTSKEEFLHSYLKKNQAKAADGL